MYIRRPDVQTYRHKWNLSVFKGNYPFPAILIDRVSSFKMHIGGRKIGLGGCVLFSMFSVKGFTQREAAEPCPHLQNPSRGSAWRVSLEAFLPRQSPPRSSWTPQNQRDTCHLPKEEMFPLGTCAARWVMNASGTGLRLEK